MPLPAQQPREPLFTTCVKRGRNGSCYFKNLFLAPFRGLEKRDFPEYSSRARHSRWDPALRVVEGARVAGAAVFPLLTSPIHQRPAGLS